jgi:hypothetical protein
VRSCSLEAGQILSYSPVWRLSSSVNVSGQQSNPSPEGVREARKWKQILGPSWQLVCYGESLLLLGDGKLDGESQGCGVQSCKNEVNSGSFGEREDGNTKSSIPGE